MPTLAPSASDRDGSSSQIKIRIASTSPAGERAYGAPAVDTSARRRIRSEYAGTAPSGDGARLGGGGGPPSQRLCAGPPARRRALSAAGAAEAERAAPRPRRRPPDPRGAPFCGRELDQHVAGRGGGPGHGPPPPSPPRPPGRERG